MLTPFDDYPIHQTPAPMAQPVSADTEVLSERMYGPDTVRAIGIPDHTALNEMEMP